MAEDETPIMYRVLHAALRPAVKVLWRPRVRGLEHVPTSGPAILAPNHQSFLDSVFLPVTLDRPVFFLGKSDYFTGYQRYFYESLGVMPVYREGGDAGEASLRKGQHILESGRILGIYPEGTRSGDGRLYRGKTGPVRLAMRTGAPILPVALTGTFEVLPADKRVPKLKQIGIQIGRPLDMSRYGGDENDRFAIRSATDELMYEIMQMSGQTYVDAYASLVKAGKVDPDSVRLDELGQVPDPDQLRKAS